MMPLCIDNCLPIELYKNLRAMVRLAPLSYGSKSNRDTDPYGHMSWKPLHDSSENLADLSRLPAFGDHLREIWNVFQRRYVEDMLPVRTYANLYSYGMDGYMHTDSSRAGERTCIIYICDDWKYDWAGETVCLSDDGKTYWSFVPVVNRALIIPSTMRHAARAVSRKCPVVRATFMFKVRPRRGLFYEALSSFLVDHGALNFSHKQGSLHDHLMRTHELLAAKKSARLEVQLAGGLHSIYGTSIYTDKMLEPTAGNRDRVRSIFGYDAEDLAFRFSQLRERPQCLENSSPLIDDHFNLRMIECANLLDQGSLDRWPRLQQYWNEVS